MNGHRRQAQYPSDRSIQPDDTKWPSEKEPSEKQHSEKSKTFCGLVAKFATSTSLQGPAFIERSNYWWSKTFWTVAFLAALGAGTWQSYEVVDKYFSYETTTSISIDYSQLEFPSITICNLNPVRRSKVPLGGQDFADFMAGLAPNTDYEENRLPGPGSESSSDGKSNPSFSDIETRRDDVRSNQGNFGSGNKSESESIREYFNYLYTQSNLTTREEMGHQLKTVILTCQYDGLECSAKNFTSHLDDTYGNCYTFNDIGLQDIPIQTRHSGINYGLDLIIFIQRHEYLAGYTYGQGIRVTLHPFNSLSFPSSTGISVSPGTETYIGLRLVNITRLGKPYGTCNDDGAFAGSYPNIKYNIESCINTCLDRTILTKCSCYRQEQISTYPEGTPSNFPNCYETNSSTACMLEHYTKDLNGELDCNCNPACQTDEYNLEMSFNSWPDESYWFDLVDKVCNVDNESCNMLKSNEHDKVNTLNSNFLKMRIYYKSLNFEKVEEQPSYEFEEFLSDFGGTIGLYVGASLMTGIEILEFLAEMLRFGCKRTKNKSKKVAKSQASEPSLFMGDINQVYKDQKQWKRPQITHPSWESDHRKHPEDYPRRDRYRSSPTLNHPHRDYSHHYNDYFNRDARY